MIAKIIWTNKKKYQIVVQSNKNLKCNKQYLEMMKFIRAQKKFNTVVKKKI
jgi:hypothetical protein